MRPFFSAQLYQLAYEYRSNFSEVDVAPAKNLKNDKISKVEKSDKK